MKSLLIAFSFALLTTQAHALEIRYKMVSFGTPVDVAFNDLTPLQDTVALRYTIDSLATGTRCVDRHYNVPHRCDARGQSWGPQTDYNCCLLKSFGLRVDSLNRRMALNLGFYRNLDRARQDLQISDQVVIRKKEYKTKLYFNTQSQFYGYIVYGPHRLPGDSGAIDDLNQLYEFMQEKYGQPDAKRENPVPPSNAGEKFEYAEWRQQGCILKLSLVCDGTQMWMQESVLDEKFK